jgi:hypothetical protein
MEAWEVEARECIRDLVARYNAHGDSADVDGVVDLFAPDAVMEMGPKEAPTVYRGREEIRTIFTDTRERWATDAADRRGPPHVRHFVSTHEITFQDERRARGRSYFLVLMAHGLDHWGRYFDEYEAADGRWLFTRRRVRLDGRVERLTRSFEA